MDIQSIQEPVKQEIITFNKKFRDSMKSNTPLLDRVTRYILKRKGKQIRPLLVLLTSKMLGEINESTYRAASLIELLHTASLVHDDVVDDSFQRRGVFSINALWKNKISVLVGDYLLARGLLLSVEHSEFDLLKIVSDSVKHMSEGELLQIEKARNYKVDEDVYFTIIRKKTASLISSCCACGAAAVSEDKINVEKMALFGEKVGMAFQIKDDIFDYDLYNKTGKPAALDLKEQKMTLPLIYFMNNASYMERRRIINIIKNKNAHKKNIQLLIKMVTEAGGIKYAEDKMTAFKKEAIEIISEMPENGAQKSLKHLIDFVIEREK